MTPFKTTRDFEKGFRRLKWFCLVLFVLIGTNIGFSINKRQWASLAISVIAGLIIGLNYVMCLHKQLWWAERYRSGQFERP